MLVVPVLCVIVIGLDEQTFKSSGASEEIVTTTFEYEKKYHHKA